MNKDSFFFCCPRSILAGTKVIIIVLCIYLFLMCMSSIMQIFHFPGFPRLRILEIFGVLIPIQSRSSRISGLLLALLFNMDMVCYLKDIISSDKELQSRDLAFLLACDVIKQ